MRERNWSKDIDITPILAIIFAPIKKEKSHEARKLSIGKNNNPVDGSHGKIGNINEEFLTICISYYFEVLEKGTIVLKLYVRDLGSKLALQMEK